MEEPQTQKILTFANFISLLKKYYSNTKIFQDLPKYTNDMDYIQLHQTQMKFEVERQVIQELKLFNNKKKNDKTKPAFE